METTKGFAGKGSQVPPQLRDRRLSQGLEDRWADRGSKRDPAGSAPLLASSNEDLHAPPVLLSELPPALLRVR
jgi:hypothetical protein